MMMKMMMMMKMPECRQKRSSAVVALHRSRLLMTLLTLSLCIGHVVCATHTTSENSEFQQQQHQQHFIGDVGLREEWGLPDTVAAVGRLFYYQLPKYHTTLGNFTNYKVTIVEEDKLPSWLTFNEETTSIEGVPMKTVDGQTYTLLVSADRRVHPSDSGDDPTVIPVKEYFTIRVSDREDVLSSGEDYMPLMEVRSNPHANDFRYVKCQPNAAVTKATVIIDADEGSLLAKERLNLLRNFSSHLGLPVSTLHLSPSRDDRRAIFDDSALVAGPGDVKHPKHQSGLLVQWNVGCGNVFAEHMPVLELLEITSSNGSMTKAIGYGIVGWHIASQRSVQQQTRRLKRQVNHFYNQPTATAAPLPSVMRPTGRPVPTKTVLDKEETKETRTDIPESRIVPTTISSDGPMSKPAKSPTPTTTYVTITPTRVLSTTTATSTMHGVTRSSATAPPPSWSAGVIEPSKGGAEEYSTTVRFHSTEILPGGTIIATDSGLLTAFPSRSESVVASSKFPSSKVTKRPPKTQKPDGRTTTTTSSTKSAAGSLPSNEAPVVSKPLAIVEAVVGKLLTFKIPDDLFMDVEDGENLTLLFLDHDDQMVEPSSWIRLNETSRALFGLALEGHVGMHYYQLAAADRLGKLAKTPCNVSVQPDPASNKLNHELSVTLDLDYDKVMYDLETRVNVINRIAAAFGDRDASKMIITRISPGSVVISWTNSTIPFEPCPEKEIRALLAHLLLPNGDINETFAKAMEPYRVLKGGASHLGPCAHLDSHRTATTTSVLPDEVTTSVMMPKGVEVKPREQQESNLLLLILIPIVIVAVLLLILIIICVVCYKKQKRRQKEQDKLSGLHKGIPIIFADELDDKPDTPTSTLKSRGRNDEEKQSVPPPEYPRSKPASQSSTLRSDYKSPLLTDNDEEDDQEEEEEELGNGTAAPPTLPSRRARLTQQDKQ
jgi:dystroglycan 1